MHLIVLIVKTDTLNDQDCLNSHIAKSVTVYTVQCLRKVI